MTEVSTPLCIAHRGARQEAPENTWSSIERALAYPIDGIELDVQMSIDGVPFLFHDETLWRVARKRKRVAALTFGELTRMEWGAWFGSAYKGEPLMTLESLLAKVNRCPRWLIEIKSSSRDQRNGHALRLTELVAGMIKRASQPAIIQRLMILSFNPQVLAFAHNLAPELRYVLNLTGKEPVESLDHLPISPRQLWAVDVNISRLSQAHLQWARAHQLKLLVYTVNGPRQLKKALTYGVNGMISDHPGWLTQQIKGENQVGTEADPTRLRSF